VFFVAPNRARRLAIFQSEASPQQAESLAAEAYNLDEFNGANAYQRWDVADILSFNI